MSADSADRRKGAPRFVVHRHDARNLHFDFRLEHDGVLASWAVPEGLPEDTTHNRLAVQTPDHPLDYIDFEGDIPGGEYGAGHVDVWENGTYEAESWKRDKIVVTLHPSGKGLGRDPIKLALIHTGRPEKKDWLVHRMKTKTEQHDYAPMMPTLEQQSEVEDRRPDQWAFEGKWDGVRALAYVDGHGVRLVTRNGHDVTDEYSELDGIASSLRRPAVLDGEIVALTSGHPDFKHLQRHEGPICFFAFDVLEDDGQDLTSRSYDERRDILESLVKDRRRGTLRVPPTVDGPIAPAMETSRTNGWEGIVLKKRGSHYQSGKRTRTWLKVKHHRTQEVVVGGWTEGKNPGIGALLLGIPGEDGLRFVGKVGTGFSRDDRARLEKELQKHGRDDSPFIDVPASIARDAHWAEPGRVGEVSFAEWTRDERLRQPSWRGWREDKQPGDVVRETE